MTTVDDPMPLDDALRIIRNVSEHNTRDIPSLGQVAEVWGKSITELGSKYHDVVGVCPFCGGRGRMTAVLRDGYQNFRNDPDAFAYWVQCVSCAAHGPWEKSVSSALRSWRKRVVLRLSHR